MCHGALFKLHKETRNGRLPQTGKEEAAQQREGLLPSFSSREELFRQRGKFQAEGRKPTFRDIEHEAGVAAAQGKEGWTRTGWATSG